MTASSPQTPSDTNPPWPNPGYAWYVVVILLLAYTCSFIDRMILTLLVAPIRADLGISDTQMSLLVGFAFAVLYLQTCRPVWGNSYTGSGATDSGTIGVVRNEKLLTPPVPGVDFGGATTRTFITSGGSSSSDSRSIETTSATRGCSGTARTGCIGMGALSEGGAAARRRRKNIFA